MPKMDSAKNKILCRVSGHTSASSRATAKTTIRHREKRGHTPMPLLAEHRSSQFSQSYSPRVLNEAWPVVQLFRCGLAPGKRRYRTSGHAGYLNLRTQAKNFNWARCIQEGANPHSSSGRKKCLKNSNGSDIPAGHIESGCRLRSRHESSFFCDADTLGSCRSKAGSFT
jgi:hypothetical protein